MKCNAPGNYIKGRKHPNSEDRQRVIAAMLKYAIRAQKKQRSTREVKEEESE